MITENTIMPEPRVVGTSYIGGIERKKFTGKVATWKVVVNQFEEQKVGKKLSSKFRMHGRSWKLHVVPNGCDEVEGNRANTQFELSNEGGHEVLAKVRVRIQGDYESNDDWEEMKFTKSDKFFLTLDREDVLQGIVEYESLKVFIDMEVAE